MKTCPRCKTANIPNEANFCPSCGKQLTEGTWGIVNLSQKDKVKDVVKKFILQNDTNKTLQCILERSRKIQLSAQGSETIEVSKTASLRVVADMIYIDIKLSNNDIFNKIIFYKNFESLKYRTN